MRIRWLKHFEDGQTIVSAYDGSISWRNTPLKNLTSVQLQTEEDKLFTLSGEGEYWQEDLYSVQVALGKQEGKLVARRIMKEIGNNKWLKLTVLTTDGSCKIEIGEK